MTVYDLTRDQLDDLKSAFFCDDESQEVLPDDIWFPEQIPDHIIFEHYADVWFSVDDFC